MDGFQSASIIKFPTRRAPAAETAALPPGDDPAARDEGARRLQAALAALEQAIAGQREAVARWRGALGSLGTSVQGLHTSLQDYGDRLGTLRGQLDTVSASARDLEAWADSALAQSDGSAQPK